MSPRRRNPKNRDLPPNLKIQTKPDGRVYFRYVFPDGKSAPLGSDREAAKAAANALNEKLTAAGSLVDRALANRQARSLEAENNPLLPTLVAEFKIHWLAEKKYSDRSRSEIIYKLNEYERTWPSRAVASFVVRDIAVFLNGKPNSTYVKHRQLLTDLFAFACHQGYREDNPAQITLKKDQGEKIRQRHSWEGYQSIHAISPPWLQRAMDIALRSLQRRSDLTSLGRKQVDLAANTITILQEKTRNYAQPVYIEIEMGPELRASVEACMRSELHCPNLIHVRPRRMTPQIRAAKDHPFAVLPGYLSKQFAKYRDQSGAYDHLPPEQRPSFHDLRALGAWLYEKAGYPDEYISLLSGHATEAMLAHYKAGHEKPKPVRVKAGLNLENAGSFLK